MNGLLLVNLGTPDAPRPREVRRYLREFLSDPRVIDLPAPLRALLLHLIILPVRPRRSAEAYAKVWTERGSPLLFHSQDLAAAVQARLGPTWRVELAMRYGSPSVPAALQALLDPQSLGQKSRGGARPAVDRLVILPLYPQYSSAATGSSLEAIFRVLSSRWVLPSVQVIEPFFDDPGFIQAFAARGRPILESLRPDHVLFSFHGLPERHLTKAEDCGSYCLQRADCCAEVGPQNPSCYRAQCFATARRIAHELSLSPSDYTVCFQSRLGRTPWIRPFTDLVLPELRQKGVRRVAVFCPAFVADCLETLEEIGMRARAQFLAEGGEELVLVPSLNATPEWVDAVVGLVRRQSARFALGSLPTVS
ncbi:MAG: ferrochelatase [Polyangia bacterium]